MAKANKDTFIPTNRNKLLTFYVYQVLKEFSDAEHLMTQKDIIAKIESLYGAEFDRKAISNNIEILKDMGYDISTKVGQRGVFLGERTFEQSEASFLIDAVFANRSIPARQANRISKKVLADFSKYQRSNYNYIHEADKIARGNNPQFLYTVEELNRAIKERKKVTFNYISYKADGKKIRSWKVSPYHLSSNSGNYYLICAVSRKTALMHFRVTHMENITVLDGEDGNPDEPTPPIEEVKDCTRNFDFIAYANEHIYMFSGDTVLADILLRKEEYLSYIYGQFGENVSKTVKPEGVVVSVRTNEQGLVYWLMQYGDKMEILSPQSTRDKVKKIVDYMASVYK